MFLVVFRNRNRKRAGLDAAAYAADAARMEARARAMPGFLSFKSYVAGDGEVVALSEWQDAESARSWRRDPGHAAVQARGRTDYYEDYTLFACADPAVTAFRRNGGR